MKARILLILATLTWNFIFAQSLKYRQQTENDLVLLLNQQNFLPLKRLDTLRINVISDGYAQNLISALNRYSIWRASNYNLAIVGIYDLKNFDFSQLHSPFIAILMDTNATNISSLTRNKLVKAIIFSKRADSLHQDYAVQLIFGAIGAHGKLTFDIFPYKQGYGLKTQGGLRLKYTIPQEVGLDSAFIFRKIDSIAQLGIKVHAYPGVQILAAVHGKVIFYKSYGYHTYDSIVPVKMTDLYDLASITKIAASVPCLMKLYEQGKISLNSRLGDLCRCVRHSNKDTIRLINALTHQAQLTPWIAFWKYTVNRKGQLRRRFYRRHKSHRFPYLVARQIYDGKRVRRLIFRKIRKSPLLPQKKYKYSDLSFYLYPAIIEKLTGQSFTRCLYENFYHPLGAYRLVFNPYKYFPLSQIVPTEYDSLFRHQLIHGTVHDEGAAMMGGISGHAGLFGNADDLAKLMQMYLNYGTYGGERFLSDTTVKRWTSYQFADQGNRRGLGFDKPLLKHPERGTPSPWASPLSFGHTGFTGTFTWADPQNGLLIVFLSNRVYPTRKNRNLIKYNIRTQIHDVLYAALKKKIHK